MPKTVLLLIVSSKKTIEKQAVKTILRKSNDAMRLMPSLLKTFIIKIFARSNMMVMIVRKNICSVVIS